MDKSNEWALVWQRLLLDQDHSFSKAIPTTTKPNLSAEIRQKL
jgi:hypothetical protein